jgi:hypothetical protein
VLRVLSLGAGVQSTAVLLLALDGEIGLDAAIFADTGWEPAAVYAHLERLRAVAAEAGVPVLTVSNGSIRDTGASGGSTDSGGVFLEAPFYLRNPDGGEGMARRQCTHKLKVKPIRRAIRQLLAERGVKSPRPGAVLQVFGISSDEFQRMRTSDVGYIEHAYPLVERGWTRQDCVAFLQRRGWDAPRSACIGCPFHSDHEWRKLRDESPAEFADAVAWEREVQAHGGGLRGRPFLHRQRVPLDQVDLSVPEDHGQLALLAGTWNDECAGVCGV